MNRTYAYAWKGSSNVAQTADGMPDRIAGAALIFKYLDNALFWQTYMHKAPNHFINAVETAENACLIPLLKNEAFTGKDFEATWDLIRRYRIQNDVYVENGRAVPVPLPIVVARAKLTRVILRCKDLFDTQTYSEADWAVEEAEGTLPTFDPRAPSRLRTAIPSSMARLNGWPPI